MLLSIQHRTVYRYPQPVRLSRHRIRLHPRSSPALRVHRFNLTLEPGARVYWMRDLHGNPVAVASFDEPAGALSIIASMELDLVPVNPFDFLLEPHAAFFPFPYTDFESRALAPFMAAGNPEECARVLPWLAREFPDFSGPTMQILTRLNRRLKERLRYVRREEQGVQAPDVTVDKGSGSCRDYARLMIEICRQAGLAARFVSGYFHDPAVARQSPSAASPESMHAWCEIYLPGAGWKGFDPTHGLLATETCIPCAVSIDPWEASPIQGSYSRRGGPVPSSMEVSLHLQPADRS
ncbi:MAG: transglutaminase family protein [Oceanipulchritudo sp.]